LAQALAVPVFGLLIQRVEIQQVSVTKAMTALAKPNLTLWEDLGKCPAPVMIAQHERCGERLICKILVKNFILGDLPVMGQVAHEE